MATKDILVDLNIEGKVGIGPDGSAPAYRLVVEETANVARFVMAAKTTGSSNHTGVYFSAANDGNFVAQNSSGTVRALINTNGSSYFTGGRVGIGDSTPSYDLDVGGTIRATGDVIAYSDARVKENVETLKDSLSKVNKLRGVSYTRNDIEDKSTKIGVIAQEILEVVPEVVVLDDKGRYSVSYGNIAGLLIESIKELTNRIEQLENK